MKYTFQQRKFVFNKLILALQAQLQKLNEANALELMEHQKAEIETFFSDSKVFGGPSAAKGIKDLLKFNKGAPATWGPNTKSWDRRRLKNGITIHAPVTIPKNLATGSATISSQLLSHAIELQYPTSHATKVKKLVAEIEQLEEDMFLKDAPTLKAALEKLQAKVEAL